MEPVNLKNKFIELKEQRNHAIKKWIDSGLLSFSVDDAILSNIRAYEMCMDNDYINIANETLSRIVQLILIKIKNKYCV